MSGHRRAAVALHGLHEEDRRWVLAQLPEEDCSTLSAYLDELKALGFDQKSSVSIGGGSTLGNVGAPAQPIERLQAATAEQMFHVLNSEPSSLIAGLLSIRDWTWGHSFLQMLPPARREYIRNAMNGMPSQAPGRTQYLIEACADRMPSGQNIDQLRAMTLSGSSKPFSLLKKKWVKLWNR